MAETKLIRVLDKTDELINEIVEKRKREGDLIRSKQNVVAEAILALHKKEMK